MSWSITAAGTTEKVKEHIAQLPSPTYDAQQHDAVRQFILNELEKFPGA